jgi:hypothetical protein
VDYLPIFRIVAAEAADREGTRYFPAMGSEKVANNHSARVSQPANGDLVVYVLSSEAGRLFDRKRTGQTYEEEMIECGSGTTILRKCHLTFVLYCLTVNSAGIRVQTFQAGVCLNVCVP